MTKLPDMLDLAFDVSGATPPADYPFALWAALVELAPILAAEESAGVLPLRLAEEATGPLPKRAKLVLRVPATLSEELAGGLSGQRLDVAGVALNLGAGKVRQLAAYSTVHAQLVATDEDEVPFMEGVRARLAEMNIACNLICGMRRRIGDGAQAIQGYSLVVHDLKADASLRLQQRGLGEARRYGCGIFVPYKVISGLNDD
jgi:CRISPR-associated protein Cas6